MYETKKENEEEGEGEANVRSEEFDLLSIVKAKKKGGRRGSMGENLNVCEAVERLLCFVREEKDSCLRDSQVKVGRNVPR